MKLTPQRFFAAAIPFFLLLATTLSLVAPHQAIAAVEGASPTSEALSRPQPPLLPPTPAKIPDEIDHLCPAYPGAVLLQVEKGENQTRAMFKSEATPGEIVNYYKKELTQRGWTVFKEIDEGENNARLILNKGNEQFSFSAIVQPSKVVTYFVSLRKI